jgi:hypothetical protein
MHLLVVDLIITITQVEDNDTELCGALQTTTAIVREMA